ncbi:MAG: hypothetical protein V7629_03725 [Motiliproteus sp.]
MVCRSDAASLPIVVRVVGAGLLAVAAIPSHAHGFAQRYDLPVPLWLYISGAAATVVVSFLMIALFFRRGGKMLGYPRFNLLRFALMRILFQGVLPAFLRLFSLALFVLVLAAGWLGVQAPFDNIAPTTVWVVWWVGFAYLSGLLGNLWPLVNPWQNSYVAFEYLLAWINPNRRASLQLPLPSWLGVWPAVLLYVLFSWLELIWHHSDTPASIATAALVYSLITWSGMALFGREPWLQRAEVFTLVFGLLSRFAITETRACQQPHCARCATANGMAAGEAGINCAVCFRHADARQRQWLLRPPGVGLLISRPASLSLTILVVLMLASVTFDGLMATPLWADLMQWALYSPQLRPLLLLLQPLFSDVLSLLATLGLASLVLLFLVVYLGFCALMRRLLDNALNLPTVAELAGYFVLTLIPIALAYHLAHYLSYLLIVGQYMIPLISDPFGFGWDLFGTGHYFVDIGIVSARFVWITSVIAIVVGHIIAVFLAHVMAQRLFAQRRLVLRSQIPMLVLMVGYTMASLWILAQPIVEN